MAPMSVRIFIFAFLLLCGASGASLLVSDVVAYHSAETESKLTGLLKAAAEGNMSHVQQYVERDIRPDKRGKNGDTALMWAAYKGHTSVVQYLLEVGADVNAEDSENWTPLHNAASGGHAEIIKILIANGADTDAEDDYDRTPLHWAAKGGHTNAVAALVAKDADVNAEDDKDWTPSHFAFEAGNGRNEILRILVGAGANINKKNDNGETVSNWLKLIQVADFVEPELKKAERLRGSGGFYNASAAVAGAALERFLLEWIKIEKLDIPDDAKGVRVYAEMLADKEKIGDKTHNNIKSWNRLRNYAAHGEWEEFEGRSRSVGEMLVCIRAFVQKHGRRMPSRREPNSKDCRVR